MRYHNQDITTGGHRHLQPGYRPHRQRSRGGVQDRPQHAPRESHEPDPRHRGLAFERFSLDEGVARQIQKIVGGKDADASLLELRQRLEKIQIKSSKF